MFANRKIATDHLVPPVEQRHAPAPARGDDVMADLTGDPRLTTAPVHVRAASAAAPAVATPPPPPPVPDDDAVTLSQAYQAFGEPVQRITFRKPTAADMQVAGQPFKFHIADGPGGVIIEDVETNWKSVAAYVSLLSSPPLPPTTVNKFSIDDLDACAEALVPFFMTKSAFRMPSMQRIGSP